MGEVMYKTEIERSLTETTNFLGDLFDERSASHDEEGSFVDDNYKTLKENRYFAALVPEELGGEGVSHSEMCEILRIIAQSCSSTALALSMHQHLVGAAVWKFRRGQGGEPLLKMVAEKQPVLVSTGAKDWLESNGEMAKTEGGYLVSGFKHFASQSEAGDIMITSAPYDDTEHGEQVLHFKNNCVSEAVDFIASHANVILVAPKDQIKKIECPRLLGVEVIKSDRHRNLYITYEHPPRVERSAGSHSINSTNCSGAKRIAAPVGQELTQAGPLG